MLIYVRIAILLIWRICKPENVFTEYAYFSSYADTWFKYCQAYTDLVSGRFHLGKDSFVVEVASNDGYLLQYFIRKGILVLGIEPAKNVAKVAVEKGVPTLTEFFGRELASRVPNCEATYGYVRADILRRIRLEQNYTDLDRALLCELSLNGKFYEIPKTLFFNWYHEKNMYVDGCVYWRG